MTDHETYLLLAANRISEPLSSQDDAALEGHLAVCSACRAMAAAMRRDDIRLRAELGPTAVSPRVRSRVLDEAAGRRRFDPRLLLGLAAALVLGAIGVPLIAGSRPTSDPLPSITTSDGPSTSLAPPAAVETSLSPAPDGIGAFVAGAFTYGTSPSRSGTVAAHFEDKAVGEWSRTIPDTDAGESYGGPVTCLVISGPDAWIAGPATTATDGRTDLAVLIYLHDGGPDGNGDTVVTWLTNPGQTLATANTWCEDRFTPAPPFPLTGGDVVVQAAP